MAGRVRPDWLATSMIPYVAFSEAASLFTPYARASRNRTSLNGGLVRLGASTVRPLGAYQKWLCAGSASTKVFCGLGSSPL